MPKANVNGTQLMYEENGNGEPVIFVHGSASDYRTWEYQKEVFAEHFRVITYSRRYHWPNKPIPDGKVYSMEEQLVDLEGMIQSLDAESAHLVGSSYGAFLCLLLAARDSALLRTLVLAEPPVLTLFVSNYPKPMELIKLLFSRPRTAFGIMRLGIKGIEPATKAFEQGDMETGLRTFIDGVLGTGAYDHMPKSQKEKVHDNIDALKAELLGPGFLPLNSEQVHQIQEPSLLVNGEESIGLFHRLTDRLEELLPNSDRTEIPEASHIMHEENASAFNHEVLSFIEKYGKAS